jgi:P-type E1-E2 ATPase
MDSQLNLRARRLVPTSTLPEDRLQLPAAPCAACGKDVDPLRTPSLLAFEDGLRLLCDEQCKADYRAGARARRRPQYTATPTTGVKLATPQATPSIPSPPLTDRRLPAETTRWLFLGMVAVILAGALACFENPEVAAFSALATGLSALTALQLGAASVREVGVFAWLCGPFGVVGAACAGYLSTRYGGGNLAQLGAAAAGLSILVRAFFDARARLPIERAADHLRRHLRPAARGVSIEPDSGALEAGSGPGLDAAHNVRDAGLEALEKPVGAFGGASPDKARIGDELVVRRGERVLVDGVVQLGEAMVLPFPSATTPIARGTGDTLLAGATLVDGGVRVLATRIGEDRGLARALRAGKVHAREGARLVRLASELSRYGGALSLLLAAGIWLWGSPDAGVMPLSAASALLLASPWLALRRAAEWPFAVAATAAAERGVVYQSGAALEAAGQVDMLVMTPHRTLTEGSPEVVELHALDDGDSDQLLGLTAAAELAATDHALGRAIVSYAQVRGVTLAEVRRSVAVPGRGVTALGPNGEEVVVGSRRLLLDHGVSVALAESLAARAEALGRTAVFVSAAGRVRALLALHDQLRAGARSAVQRMFDRGLEIVLLTGGQRGPVEQLASRLEIHHIKAELSAEERGQEVRSLRDGGHKVAVIGYPSDDNPALSAADVGVALGAAGGPAGDRAIAPVGGDVRDAAAALWIARAAQKGAWNAIRIACLAFVCACAAAVSGLLEPVFAAVLAVAIDAQCIHAGARLLRRIALRLPSGS